MEITFSYENFARICSGGGFTVDKLGFRESLRYIELRAHDGFCVATASDVCELWQTRVPCDGEGLIYITPVKPVKSHQVVVSDDEKKQVKVAYLDFEGKLISASLYPAMDGSFLPWHSIMPYNREGDRQIFINAATLSRVLKACNEPTKILCLKIPEDPLKPIIVIGDTTQAIVLPMRCAPNDSHDLRDWRDKGND